MIKRNYEESIGKTIAAIHENDAAADSPLVLIFNDGSYLAIKSASDFDRDPLAPEVTSIDPVSRHDGCQAKWLLEIGLWTKAEYDAWIAAGVAQDNLERQKSEKDSEAWERGWYEKLKAKFEATER